MWKIVETADGFEIRHWEKDEVSEIPTGKFYSTYSKAEFECDKLNIIRSFQKLKETIDQLKKCRILSSQNLKKSVQ